MAAAAVVAAAAAAVETTGKGAGDAVDADADVADIRQIDVKNVAGRAQDM